MYKISSGTIARTIVLILALANQVFAMLGRTPVGISEETVYTLCTVVATVGAALWSFWKNNSFTKAAIKADEKMKELKNV